MNFVDILTRGAAITVLILAASFLILTGFSWFTSDLWPFRHSLLIALIASGGAALPLVAIHLTRAASKNAPPPSSDGGTLSFKIYAALAGALAVLLMVAIISGQLRL
jgi:hypothetical protein